MTTQQAEAAPAEAALPAETPEKPAAPARTLADADTELAITKQALEKAQADLKSAQGRNKPADEIRALRDVVTELKNDMSAYKAVLKALAPEEAARIEADLNAAQGRSQLNETFQEQMDAAISDDDGNFVLPAGSPELVTLQKAYATAKALGTDTAGIRARMRAVQLASLTVQKYEMSQIAAQAEAQEKSHQAALTEAEKRGEAKAKAAYVAKVEVAPGGVNGGGGGVAPTKENIDALYIQGKVGANIYRKFLETGNI